MQVRPTHPVHFSTEVLSSFTRNEVRMERLSGASSLRLGLLICGTMKSDESCVMGLG